MINLLPPDITESTTYARRNTVLLRWAISLGVSVLIVAVLVGVGHFYLNGLVKQENTRLSDARETLKLQKVEETQKNVEDISNSLKLAIQVLSKEVLFSDLLQQIGKAMPQSTVLTGLSINKLQGGIDLRAAATDYAAATQVQVNMSDPNNKIFSKADIVSVTCANDTSTDSTSPASSSTTSSKYPCEITIRAQFAQKNPFLFINKGASQ